MKNFIIIALILKFSVQAVIAQEYVPFSQDTVVWHNLYFHQWGPDPNQIALTNYKYIQDGDTVLQGKNYKRIYYEELYDLPEPKTYIGGLREDEHKQIWFFPVSNIYTLPYNYHGGFSSDTTEHLLYTFNELNIGDTIPVNTENNTLIVTNIDSVFIYDRYRKRYEIINNNFLFDPEYWIEGIGSSKDLLSAYSYEFEWTLYTLCFKAENITYYISSPNQDEICYYGTTNLAQQFKSFESIIIFPNPATTQAWLQLPENTPLAQVQIEFYSHTGRLLYKAQPVSQFHKIDLAGLPKGLYLVRLWDGKSWLVEKLVVG